MDFGRGACLSFWCTYLYLDDFFFRRVRLLPFDTHTLFFFFVLFLSFKAHRYMFYGQGSHFIHVARGFYLGFFFMVLLFGIIFFYLSRGYRVYPSPCDLALICLRLTLELHPVIFFRWWSCMPYVTTILLYLMVAKRRMLFFFE